MEKYMSARRRDPIPIVASRKKDLQQLYSKTTSVDPR